jgi:hypothetical protein
MTRPGNRLRWPKSPECLCPQGEPEVSEPRLRPIFEDFPAWLGGMTQEEAGLAEMLVAVA